MSSSLKDLYCSLAVADLPRKRRKETVYELHRLFGEASEGAELRAVLTDFQPPAELKVFSPAAIAAGKLANRFEPLFSLAAASLLIILFTLFRDRLQIVLSTGTSCAVYAIFQPGFLALIPLLTARWSLEIIGSLASLLLGRKVTAAEWLEVFLALFDFILLGYLLSGGIEKFFSLDILRSTGLPILIPLMQWVCGIGLGLLMIFQLSEINRLLRFAVDRRALRRFIAS